MYICVYNCYINNVFIKLILLTSCYQWRKQIYNVRQQMNLLLWLRLYAYGIFKTAIGRKVKNSVCGRKGIECQCHV